MLRLPRLNDSKNRLSVPCCPGGMYRLTSPPAAGSSILMISAPMSARKSVPQRPATARSSAPPAPRGALDLEDPRAHVGEEERPERPGAVLLDSDDTDARQGRVGV